MNTRSRQQGVALVVVLLLLLVMTLLGLTSLRGTLLQERMSANTADRSRVFQVAETALREAETLTAAASGIPAPGCTNGICGKPTGAPVWTAPGFWDSGVSRASTSVVPGINASFVAEYMGPAGTSSGAGGDCTTCGDPDAPSPPSSMALFRITVRAIAADTQAEVVLQSGYEVAVK